MNYYHRYCGDYIKKTLDLTMVEDGAYTRLLDWLYANDRPIPHERRHMLTRCQSAVERRAVDSILEQFFIREGDAWTHERAQEEIAEAKGRIATAKANGAKGGRPPGSKNKTQKIPTGLISGNPESNPESNPGDNQEANPLGSPTGTHEESSPYSIHQTINKVGGTATSDGSDPGDGFANSKAGDIGRAFRAAGVPDDEILLSDSRMAVLLEDGATVDEFREVIAEAVNRRADKPFPYVLATMARRHAEAKASTRPAVAAARAPAQGRAVHTPEETQAYLDKLDEETERARASNAKRKAARQQGAET